MPFVTTTEAGVPIQGPTATLIYDDWYPALRTDSCAEEAGDRHAAGHSAGAGAQARRPLFACATTARIAAFR